MLQEITTLGFIVFETLSLNANYHFSGIAFMYLSLTEPEETTPGDYNQNYFEGRKRLILVTFRKAANRDTCILHFCLI